MVFIAPRTSCKLQTASKNLNLDLKMSQQSSKSSDEIIFVKEVHTVKYTGNFEADSSLSSNQSTDKSSQVTHISESSEFVQNISSGK